jgi:hypothetical protein
MSTRIFLQKNLVALDLPEIPAQTGDMKRYTLNVTKDVYLALMDIRSKELQKSGKAPTVDEVLRKQLRLGKEKTP